MRYRRITAAIADIIIFTFLMSLIIYVFPLDAETKEKYYKVIEIEESVSNMNDLTSEQRNEITTLSFEVEHTLVKYYLIAAILIVVYFVLIPMYLNNQTVGQHIRKVRLVSDDKITINTYIIRAILNSGLILLILLPFFLYISNAIWYSRINTILILSQFTYWIISIFMLLITKKTIHDKLTRTSIIEVKR